MMRGWSVTVSVTSNSLSYKCGIGFPFLSTRSELWVRSPGRILASRVSTYIPLPSKMTRCIDWMSLLGSSPIALVCGALGSIAVNDTFTSPETTSPGFRSVSGSVSSGFWQENSIAAIASIMYI